jgi:protein-S-isoprenylcysteine O-methyltransferase Ste14
MLVLRALFAFLVLPGIVAFVLPGLVLDPPPWARQFDSLAFVSLVPGLMLIFWCTAEFYRQGRGTLAPWDPPRTLVVSGAYSVSRNPMYVAVVLILAGWSIGYRSVGLALYTLVVAIAFHVRVVVHEEPFLARTYGREWRRYRERVPRWIWYRSRDAEGNGGAESRGSDRTTSVRLS